MQIKSSHLILDACCIFNFCASGHFLEIIESVPAQVYISKIVNERELLTLKEISGENQFLKALQKESILLTDFISDEEAEAFVNYVFAIGDDGESATFAIAINRGWSVATDDKRTINFFKIEAPQVQVLSTLEIVKNWSETKSISKRHLGLTLENIRKEGRYIPKKNDPLFTWWETAIRK